MDVKLLVSLFGIGMLVGACGSHTQKIGVGDSNNSLAQELAAKKDAFNASAPTRVKQVYGHANDSLAQSSILSEAINVGDSAVYFTLPNANGEMISLQEELKKGPVVLLWYRGGWCPYCNITLHYMQEKLPEITAAGAQLIAISPEMPDESLSTQEKHGLDFHVLSDTNNVVAKQYGIVFSLTNDVASIYEEKFDLSTHNGNQTGELPLPATYIIQQDGIVSYAFLDTDYRKRAEPDIIVSRLSHHAK